MRVFNIVRLLLILLLMLAVGYNEHLNSSGLDQHSMDKSDKVYSEKIRERSNFIDSLLYQQ
ncbi:MAG: hypothetical protein R2780_04385 [Crocinitomicaceae bacterium]